MYLGGLPKASVLGPRGRGRKACGVFAKPAAAYPDITFINCTYWHCSENVRKLRKMLGSVLGKMFGCSGNCSDEGSGEFSGECSENNQGNARLQTRESDWIANVCSIKHSMMSTVANFTMAAAVPEAPKAPLLKILARKRFVESTTEVRTKTFRSQCLRN